MTTSPTPRRSSLLTRLLTASLAALLALALLPSAVLAGHNEGDTDPCGGAPSAEDFADYDQARETHRPSIDCALYRAITSGAGTNAQGDPVYKPRARVTRAQMAQFIVNTLVAAGHDAALPNGQGQDEFNDIRDNFARVAINRLARAEIVSGVGGNRYNPGGFVSRQQMASFIVQAARFAVGEDHPVRRDNADRFRDVANNNVHKGNIEAGADADLFRGTSATTFNPGAQVVRDQMASFLVNLLDYTFDPDQAPPPNTAEVNIADRTVDAGGELTGDITGENVASATASGCGLTDEDLDDTDGAAEGIQFEVTIPENQRAGQCPLEIDVIFDNNSIRRFTENITVVAGNAVTVTVAKTSYSPGDAVTGEITGNNLKSATVSGCGLNNEPAQDRDTAKVDIQFSEVIPSTQALGSCTLTFRVTFNDNTTEDVTKTITVIERTGVTTQPELIAAQVISTSGANTAAPGTTVKFTFDETVTGEAPVPGNFFIYSFDATREQGSSQRIEAADLKSVLVRFANVTTTTDAADYTVATVVAGAVTDDQSPSQNNPEGSAPIGAAREDTIRTAGATAAPDLQSIGGFRAVDQSTTAVDFTFDEPAFVFNPAGFRLVLLDGTVVNCQGPAVGSNTPGGGSAAGGNGTNRITAVCTNPSSGQVVTPVTSANVARGYVETETVSDTAQDVEPLLDTIDGNANPLQVAPTGGAAPTTATPDLVSATFTAGAGNAPDQVVYKFDETILATPAPDSGGFAIYNTAGDEVTSTGATRGTPFDTVVATYAAGTLDDAVGAIVRPGAVTGSTGAAEENRADETGVTNSTTRTITPGKTAGPDLVSVAVNPGAGSATYTFDENVNASPTGDQAATPGNFSLWLSSGIRLDCFGIPGTGTFAVDGTKVTCSAYRIGMSQQATAAQVGSAVLGTVVAEAVDDAEGGMTTNPEGAAATTGGTGQPEK